jgi:hypothetical protein
VNKATNWAEKRREAEDKINRCDFVKPKIDMGAFNYEVNRSGNLSIIHRHIIVGELSQKDSISLGNWLLNTFEDFDDE